MGKRILWLDNDLAYIRPYVNALKAKDYEVHSIPSLSEAESLLGKYKFDLIIVDVMMPTQDKVEVKNYPDVEIDFGNKTGLLFYKRIRGMLGTKLPPVIAMTVRMDQDIKDEFIQVGLRADLFWQKYNVNDITEFLKKIRQVLGE
jgi:CheY-like chemotaxis protein